MPAARPMLPTLPPQGASADELGASLTALLEWLTEHRLAALLEAGLTTGDVFRLRRAAAEYRRGTLSGETITALVDLAPALDRVRLF